MRIGLPSGEPNSGWTAPVHQAQASGLVRAFDPAHRHVVIEGHSPIGTGWNHLPVTMASASADVQNRSVRNLRFDLLMAPEEVVDAGPDLDAADQGWLYAWQTPRQPPQHLRLGDKHGEARAAALRGAGVTLLIDLPHRGETAVLWSPDRATLDAALRRLDGQS
ncbi:MAG TPA: hypothetical protein VG247_36790 [Pseudonocardiaceae bacterium]|jgi:hypothetical protein|nr:hypothetical protein [Pseudonocardiaceae bacterium]